MEWSFLIDNFTAALGKFSITREADKVAYLKAALKSKESQNLVMDEAKSHSYSGMMKQLEARYYRPSKVFRQIVQGSVHHQVSLGTGQGRRDVLYPSHECSPSNLPESLQHEWSTPHFYF